MVKRMCCSSSWKLNNHKTTIKFSALNGFERAAPRDELASE